MRNLGFITGVIAGYLMFTEEGKDMSKKFLGRVDEATKEIMSMGKDVVKETMPETTKRLRKKEVEN